MENEPERPRLELKACEKMAVLLLLSRQAEIDKQQAEFDKNRDIVIKEIAERLKIKPEEIGTKFQLTPHGLTVL
jgi:hypothetical protein